MSLITSWCNSCVHTVRMRLKCSSAKPSAAAHSRAIFKNAACDMECADVARSLAFSWL